MARGFGLLSVLVSLGIVGALFSSQLSQGSQPSGRSRSSAVQQANAAAAGLTAVQAERQLSAYQADHGTFAGATLTGISGVTILRADANGFCLRLATAAGVLYDAEPGGTPTTQHC